MEEWVTPFTLYGVRNVLDFPVAFPVAEHEIETYILSPGLSRRIGLTGPSVVAVVYLSNPEPGLPILYRAKGKYEIDRVIYDSRTKMYGVERDEGDFIVFTKEIGVLGIVIGHCGPQRGIYDRLIFRKIPGVCER